MVEYKTKSTAKESDASLRYLAKYAREAIHARGKDDDDGIQMRSVHV
jgi:hypothetical protein